jgi:3',5'-nucleoside bisphosphate phosphatase
MIDLHIHTIASDGQHTGSEIVGMARELGLSAIAIADHNSVESVGEAEAAATEAGIAFAPAVEFDTIFRGRDLHLLGYFIAYQSPACAEYIAEIFTAKIAQTRQRVARLNELGFVIAFDELLQVSEGRLPAGKQYIETMRRHPENFANPDFMAFIDGPRARSPFLNFYLDWLRAGRPAFVPLEVQPTERAIREIKKMGGVPVLAHPSDTPVEDVHALIDAGLMGLEVYTSYHDGPASAKFLALAQDRKVLVTAGSDFHGIKVKPDVKLGGIEENEHRLFETLKSAAGR